MAVREFNGTTDLIAMGGGTLGALCNGNYSVIAIENSLVNGSQKALASLQVSTTTLLGGLAIDSVNVAVYTSTEAVTGFLGHATGWSITAMSHASGTTNPRLHYKPLGSGTWAHGDASGTVANNANSITRVEIGAFLGATFSSAWNGRMATVAVFASALTDLQVESVQTVPSTQQLYDLGAVGLWDFNQASTATTVPDLVGTASEASISGTSVVTTDDPPGWTFGIASTTVPTLHFLHPTRLE